MKKILSTIVLAFLLANSINVMFKVEPAAASPTVVDPNYVLEVFATGLDGPFGMAFDNDGNLYVANEGAELWPLPGTISKITPDGQVSTYATGFEGPSGLAFDNEENLWVSDDTSHVWKIMANGNIILGSDFDFGNPNAIAFDKDWNLLVASHIYGCIYKMDQNGYVSVFADPFNGPQALAFDELGNVYTSDHDGKIYKIDPESGAVIIFTENLGATQGGLAFDSEGNLYASQTWGSWVASPGVLAFAPDGSNRVFVTGFDPNYPRGLAFDSLGRLYITEYNTGIIWRARVANKVGFEISHGYWCGTYEDTIVNIPIFRRYQWLFQTCNLKDETGQPMINPKLTVTTERELVSFSSEPTIFDGEYVWNFSLELPEDFLLPIEAREQNYSGYSRPRFSAERHVYPEILVEPVTVQDLSLNFTLEEPLPPDVNTVGIQVSQGNVVFLQERLVEYSVLWLSQVEDWSITEGFGWNVNPSDLMVGKTYSFNAKLEAVKSPKLGGSPTVKPQVVISFAHWDDLGILGIGSSAAATHPEGLAMNVSAEGEYEWHASISYSRQDFFFHQVVSEIVENPNPPPPYVVKIPATIDIKPDSYNWQRHAKWVTCYIELPEGYDVHDINASTVLLNGVIPANLKPIAIGDYDKDGILDLMVKFEVTTAHTSVDMTKLIEDRFLDVTVTVTGRLDDGTLFQGSDTVKIIMPMLRWWKLIKLY